MPTEEVCRNFEELHHMIVNFLDLRKQVERQEQEMRNLQAQRAMLTGAGPNTPSSPAIPASTVSF